MRSGARATLFLTAWLFMAMPAQAQLSASGTMQPAAPALRPGQYIWYEQPQLIRASMNGAEETSIVVSLSAQQAYVYRGGRLVGVTTVSTGARGKATPLGQFTILQKKPFHRSNIYSNAPMPYMQRLTWTGIAIHAGHLPGYPASHGCIRLPAKFARQLYDLTRLGGSVSVVEQHYDVAPTYMPKPSPLLVADTRNLGGESYNVVTMTGPPPAAMRRPASWVTGPSREIVQPVPRGSR
jgi:hypothetical protein